VLALSRFINAFKPLAIILIIVAAPASFYMLQYGIVIDSDMLINTMETDPAEAGDQLSTSFFITLIALGIIPSLLLVYIKIPKARTLTQMKQSLVTAACFCFLAVGIAYTSYDDFASLFRNHRDVKYRIVPFNVISASVSVIRQKLEKPAHFNALGQDAVQTKTSAKPRIMVVILGETARADHFSLNGYERPTTPMLSQLATSEQLLSYKDAISCGTATAVSVPWCKDVCNRINTTVMNENRCGETDCYDFEMLDELSSWLQNITQDSIIVLHQMGSHGPAYYKRSPEKLKRFLPECKSEELTNCTKSEIINAYDNSLLITDRLVSQAVRLLRSHKELDSSMMYVSDHGESLGDNGIYLHGLPNWLAPKEQRHIPWIVWPSGTFEMTGNNTDANISHDNFSHTVLGYFNVETSLYNASLDLTQFNERYVNASTTP
jgi:lipid A ethanolaminephosphotransferase